MTHLVILPVDHRNCQSSYYYQEQLCNIELHSHYKIKNNGEIKCEFDEEEKHSLVKVDEKARVIFDKTKLPKNIILTEDDANQVSFSGQFSKGARVESWYDPDVYALELKMLKIGDALRRLESNPFHPHPADIHTLVAFTVGKAHPETFSNRGKLDVGDLKVLARYHYTRLFNKTFEMTFPKRQEFLKNKIEVLAKEGANTIHLIGGRLHFDDDFLQFITSLGISYQIIDQQPQPSAAINLPKMNIQTVA